MSELSESMSKISAASELAESKTVIRESFEAAGEAGEQLAKGKEEVSSARSIVTGMEEK